MPWPLSGSRVTFLFDPVIGCLTNSLPRAEQKQCVDVTRRLLLSGEKRASFSPHPPPVPRMVIQFVFYNIKARTYLFLADNSGLQGAYEDIVRGDRVPVGVAGIWSPRPCPPDLLHPFTVGPSEETTFVPLPFHLQVGEGTQKSTRLAQPACWYM